MKCVASDEPGSGVSFVRGVEHLEAPPAEYLDQRSVSNVYSHLDGFRALGAGEVPEGVVWGVEYGTYVVNSPVYCAHLLRKFLLRGGEVKKSELVNLMEGFSLAKGVRTVVNCSGVGIGDPKAFIIRGMFCAWFTEEWKRFSYIQLVLTFFLLGQTCLVRNAVSETITRQNTDGSWSFCIPRPLDGGTIIGGTKEPHNWDPNPSVEARERLLANATKWFPFTPASGGKFDVIRDIVGRRPAREGGMRIEVEKIANDRYLVHGYGAGGRGFELSRGVAEDIAELMLDNGLLRPKASL
jgi:D-amino-acid oxidase